LPAGCLAAVSPALELVVLSSLTLLAVGLLVALETLTTRRGDRASPGWLAHTVGFAIATRLMFGIGSATGAPLTKWAGHFLPALVFLRAFRQRPIRPQTDLVIQTKDLHCLPWTHERLDAGRSSRVYFDLGRS
jgi:hypothetical protein